MSGLVLQHAAGVVFVFFPVAQNLVGVTYFDGVGPQNAIGVAYLLPRSTNIL